ncbi:peptidylprolyl isomerase SurA [Psychromonas aquatilis]|uniref:Chaperone SurA n=1 Tax=Psychromonas aquatilis TaxID=2005072 RepID=A0ABU9GPU3_9GAMM
MKFTKKLLSALILASSIPSFTNAAEVQLDNIEAVVNKEIILSSDMQNLKKELVQRYQESGQTLPDKENIDKQILDKLITDSLQLQVAEQIGLRISDARLDQTLVEMAKKQNTTLDKMRADIEASGGNYKQFVEGVRNELTINEVRQIQVRRRITITDQEVEQVIDRINQTDQANVEFNFAHILLKTSESTSTAQKAALDKEAASLVEKIKSGEDIKQLALTYSEGPKALEGGDWGWRNMEEMPSLFAAEISETDQKGDIIGPFHSDLGVHIIQILDKKGGENVMTEEVNARHILVKPSIILSDEQAQQLLQKIRQQILDGSKSFEELAREYSQDPGSAVKGGNLGWADPNIYVPEFRDLAQSQEVGVISQPFHTDHGWHILQIMDKRQSDTTEAATKQKAYTLIFRQRFPAEAYAWLNELRQEAYIKINNPDYIIEER